VQGWNLPETGFSMAVGVSPPKGRKIRGDWFVIVDEINEVIKAVFEVVVLVVELVS
jgi:hypothetical protein